MLRNKIVMKYNRCRLLPSTIGRVCIVLIAAVLVQIGLGLTVIGDAASSSKTDLTVVTEKPTSSPPDVSTTKSPNKSRSPETIPPTVSSEIAKWIQRQEEIANGIQSGRMDHKDADLFYKELNAAISKYRDHFRNALSILTSRSSQQNIAPPPKKTSQSPEKSTAPNASQKPALPVRSSNNRMNLLANTEQLWVDLKTLYALRIELMDLISPGLRNKVTGTGAIGTQAFREELDFLSLNVRYRLYLLPRLGGMAAGNFMRAPIPVIFTFAQLALAVLVFYWWRRWAREGIAKARRNILDLRPRKSLHKRLAKWLWYFSRVRNPVEWFLFLMVVVGIIGTTDRLVLDLLWTKAEYILVAWFIVLLVDAMVSRGAAGLRGTAAKLRLRSIWLVVLWILVTGLGLNISDNLVGKGTIHAWVWIFAKVLALPMLLLLIHWWRPEIYRKLEDGASHSARSQWILQHRKGNGSYPWAFLGAVYLLGDYLRQQVLKRIAAFEAGRYFIANLTRIEAVRASERRRQRKLGEPIPETMRQRLFACEGLLVESVGQDVLEQMADLVDDGQPGVAVIVAERGAGKSRLLQRLDEQLESKMVLFDCPPGGLGAFNKALAEALELEASRLSPDVITQQLQNNQVRFLGIDNLHRLSRPVLGGQRDMDQLTELIKAIQTDTFWFLGIDWAAWQYISRVRANRLFVQNIFHLPLWSETEIRELIEQHTSQADFVPDFSALTLPRHFQDMDYDTVEERNSSGFYRILWNASDGNPVVALQLWADALNLTPDGRILVSLPQLPATGKLENAHINVLLTLRVIAQSGYANLEEIAENLRFPVADVVSTLNLAATRQWVESVDGRYRLTWKWFRSITRVLARRNLLVRRTVGGKS